MRTLAALTAAASALALGACGSDDKSSAGSSTADSTPTPTETATPAEASGGGGETIALAADPGGAIKFDKTELTAKAGKATIEFTNNSAVPHAVEIEGNGSEEQKTDVVTKGSAKVDVDLKPGTYEYYCPVGSHRSQGMEGKLVVK